ncbi:MAG: sugar phosphate isomerase/epimerase [Nanoarchaeota archaeon]|nr:sugar phosphate isomerase/epimerase [Nanoarchaeota archaeon]
MSIGGDYSSSNFYSGADYGFDPKYNQEWVPAGPTNYTVKPGDVGYAVDPLSANQLDAVNKKLNTGASVIEVQGLGLTGGSPGAHIDKIPKQQFKEIERLKKLTGVELTFHAPLIEPSGFTRQGWDEIDRKQAEHQLWKAVERAQQMESKGNLVVTFHSGVVGVDAETKIKEGKNEIIKEVGVMDLAKGQYANLNIKPNYLIGDDGKILSLDKQREKIQDMLKKQSDDAWFQRLYGISYHGNQGLTVLKNALNGIEDKEGALKKYKEFLNGGASTQIIDAMGEKGSKVTKEVMDEITHASTYLRDAYQTLQTQFNDAYESAQVAAKMGKGDSDLKKLDAFRGKISGNIKTIKEPENLQKLGELIIEGSNVLSSIDEPNLVVSMKDFALDKSSDTFSNLAFNAYNSFKDNAPIISIENPPAGSAPLDRAEDLKKLVLTARGKLTDRLVSEKRMSKKSAERQAEKLIGVTWDVGHINMIRKFGYSEEDTIKEAEKIAKYVKHVHLSDNFGLEHTELPMGMGNVPIGKILELKKGFEKAKKIVETGDWFSRQGGLSMTQTPVVETLRALGSPIYSMQMGPTWSSAGMQGKYFSGYGATLPQQHFNTYGAGFSGLPQELGGQVAGVSRASGAPVD